MAKPGVGTNQYGAFGSNHLEEGSGMVVKDVVANEAWGIEAPHLGRVNVPGCAIHNDNFVGVSLHVSPSAKVYKEHDENPHRREFPHHAAERRFTFSGSQASALVQPEDDPRADRSHPPANEGSGASTPRDSRAIYDIARSRANFVGNTMEITPGMSERGIFTGAHRSKGLAHVELGHLKEQSSHFKPGWLREGSTPPFAIETDNRIAGASEDVINGRQRQIKTAARRQSFAGSAAAALVEFHPETLSPRAMAKMMQRNAPEHKQRRHFPKEEKRNRRGSLSSSMGGELAGALTPRPGADNAPAGQRVPRRGIDMELGKRTSDRRMSDFHTSMLAIGVDRPESSALVEQREQAENLGRRGSMMLQHWREQDMREMLARQEAARIVVAPREETKEVADKKGRRMSCRGPVKGAHEGGRVRHTTDSSMMNAVLFNR